MATFSRSDDLQGAEFVDADLRGARFVGADLSGVVMRGVDVDGCGHRRAVAPRRRQLLARQRRRRGPVRRGRAQPPLPRPRRPAGRRSGRPARGLGGARAHLGGHARARRGDAGRHGRRLGGRRVVVRADAAAPGPGHGRVAGPGDPGDRAAVPPHRPGWTPAAEDDGLDMSIFTTIPPSYAEVLEVRAGRVAMVRDFLATVTPDELAATRKNPLGPRTPGDHPLLPARDPRGGVGAPPLRRARPRIGSGLRSTHEPVTLPSTRSRASKNGTGAPGVTQSLWAQSSPPQLDHILAIEPVARE